MLPHARPVTEEPYECLFYDGCPTICSELGKQQDYVGL